MNSRRRPPPLTQDGSFSKKRHDGEEDGDSGKQGRGKSSALASSGSGNSRNRFSEAIESDEEDDPILALPSEIVLERAERPRLDGKGTRRPSYTVRAPGTPFHELDLSEIPWLHHHQDEENAKRGLMRYRRLFFLAGILAGAVLAWALSHHVVLQTHIRHLRSVIDDQLNDLGVNLTSLDLPSFSMPSELVQLGNDLFSAPRKWTEQLDFSVGQRLHQQGLNVDRPVILLPGIVSTGLESWSTEVGVFRKRLWGSVSMVRTIATQKEMWIKHLSLDPHTGLDPPGIKVRAAEGLDAASYFVSGYWIWARIIENLAAIGYDTNHLWLASYDWRLSFHNLEVRDRFFSRMKIHFEQNLALTGKKSVLVSHSMGSSVALYFLKWVEASGPGYGNGGPDWVERHVDSFVSIAGTFLGVPKAMAALLSGEMRDTVELPPAAAYLLEKFFSRRERAKLFRTWAGSASMLIKGGDAVWGNETWAPDDEPNTASDLSHGKMYSFRLPGDATPEDHAKEAVQQSDNSTTAQHHLHNIRTQQNVPRNLTADGAFTWLLQHTPSTFQQMVQQNYSNGIEYSEEQVKKNNQIEKTWSNPLEAALPNAPSMKIHCIYGVGKQTERSYWYIQGPYERDEYIVEGDSATCLDCGNSTTSTPLDFPTGRTGWIDTSVHDEKATPQVRSGVKFSDGDGTVSTHSLGAMCIEGWKRKRYNPADIKVYTHEIAHEPEPLDLRGGRTTGDHVDILGSFRVNEIVLRVAAGLSHTVNESFYSNARVINTDEKLTCHKCGRRKKRKSLSHISKRRNRHLCKKCGKIKKTKEEGIVDEEEMAADESTIEGDETTMTDEDADSVKQEHVVTDSVSETGGEGLGDDDHRSDRSHDCGQHLDRQLLDSWRLDPRHLIEWVSKSIQREIVDDTFSIDDLYKLSDSALAQSRFEMNDRDSASDCSRSARMTYDQRKTHFNKAMPTAGVFRKAFLRYALIRSKEDALLLLTFLYFLSSVADPSMSGSSWATMRSDVFRFCNERFGKKIGYLDWLPRK